MSIMTDLPSFNRRNKNRSIFREMLLYFLGFKTFRHARVFSHKGLSVMKMQVLVAVLLEAKKGNYFNLMCDLEVMYEFYLCIWLLGF